MLIESAFVYPVVFLVVLGIITLGVGVFPLNARRFASRECVIFRLRFGKPAGPANQGCVRHAIQRDEPSTAPFCFGARYRQRALNQVYLPPAQRPNFILSERRVQRERYDGAEQRVGLARRQQSSFLLFRHGLADVI